MTTSHRGATDSVPDDPRPVPDRLDQRRLNLERARGRAGHLGRRVLRRSGQALTQLCYLVALLALFAFVLALVRGPEAVAAYSEALGAVRDLVRALWPG